MFLQAKMHVKNFMLNNFYFRSRFTGIFRHPEAGEPDSICQYHGTEIYIRRHQGK